MHGQWESFFLGETGAAAALTGLLFVAVSINIDRIIEFAWLPARAAQALTLLVGALVVSSVVLLPDQSTTALGLELLVVGVAIWGIVVAVDLRNRRHPEYREVTKVKLQSALSQVATLPAIIAAVVVLAGSWNGLYVLAFGVLASFVVAIFNAWILLVEIRR